MPLYTKLGDSGQTKLYGGEEISKAEPRIQAYGTIDELNALVGVIIAVPRGGDESRDAEGVLREASLRGGAADAEVRDKLTKIQHTLYRAGADLATTLSNQGDSIRITQDDVEEIEKWIDEEGAKVPALDHFILPGGSLLGAKLHLARTICRRAERWLVTLVKQEEKQEAESVGVNFAALRYLNRLGDFFFALARTVNSEANVPEVQAGGGTEENSL